MDQTKTKTSEDLDELLTLLTEKEAQIHYNKFATMFPDTGPYSRDKYKPHVKFIQASSHYRLLGFIAANRIGKTETGAYITAMHLTGDYPKWYTGRRFTQAVDVWASGISNQATKEIQQRALLGPVHDIGSGLIPKSAIIGSPTKKPGVADAIETVRVKHKSGGTSTLTFKSYEQGRESFQGTYKQLIWLDEEPTDESIYSECVMRLADEFNPGMLICTFTPLFGLTGIALKFLPDIYATRDGSVTGNPHMFAIQADWDDAPHLSEDDKAMMLSESLPHQKEARSKGIPSMGSGAIYPFMEDSIVCEPRIIPDWWPRAYGLDTGWNRTAAVWGALDPDTNTFYIYHEYYVQHEHLAIRAHALKQPGRWITGAADPDGVNPVDGAHVFDLLVAEGLILEKADKKNVDGGLLKVSQMFASGQLKIFSTCLETLKERRKYHRDEKGKIIKKDDHLMDALRYLCTTGMEYLSVQDEVEFSSNHSTYANKDSYTGY